MSQDRFVSSPFFVEIEAPSSFLVILALKLDKNLVNLLFREIKRESPMKGVVNLLESENRTQFKKSKKSRPVREPVRAPSVESLSASDESEREGSDREGSERECVGSNFGEQIMLPRIIDEEREYGRQGNPIDTWNYWLNVKQKNIWWKELYELDQAARVLPKKKDKEKMMFAEGSSFNSGLDSRLQGLEERILEFMGEGFVGLNLTVETKLESLGSRMSDIEKNQRLLRRRAKKIKGRLRWSRVTVKTWIFDSGIIWTMVHMKGRTKLMLSKTLRKRKITSRILSKRLRKKNENSDEEEGEEKEADDNAQQEGEKEAGEQDKEDSESESETDELKQLKERSRAQANKLWKELEADEEEGNKMKKKVKRKRLKPVRKKRRTVRMMRKLKKKWWNLRLKGKMIKKRLEGKRIKKKKLKGKSLKPGSKKRRKAEIEKVVESEAREAEIEKGTPTPPQGTPKDDHNEPWVETNRTDETPTPPRGNQTEGTTTPPREEKNREKVVEEEKKEEDVKVVEEQTREVIEEHAGEIVEEYTEEKNQRWIMVVYKEALSPWIMHRCKEKTMMFGKLSLQVLLYPKMSKMNN
ncbi:LOW QUALITY PROTEIN: hypothetical protein HID58_055746 [Brassica napus]|uniref:DUF287 domain-containing protein n=1 Tax=Brassica napus TaxID=3708 RepID=A0ABQ8AM47_BRANA|nr:LOW QUALITY PROTEIN: hypothetical protein HID58_055746 [Brassica napus]